MQRESSTNITWHGGGVTREERAAFLRQKGCTVWFTGLSGSGKSTIAMALERALVRLGHPAYVLDGDNVRFGLNAGPKILAESRGYSEAAAQRFGLGFSADDREENVRRVGEVARLFADAGLVAIASFISPRRKDRDAVRALHERDKAGAIAFVEVHVGTEIGVCESRDPKGLYKQARKAVADGKGMGFTGVDDPYEPPAHAELTVDTGTQSVAECVDAVLAHLRSRGLVG